MTADSGVPRWVIDTQEGLGTLLQKPRLTSERLQKPPFRFLFDIIVALHETQTCLDCFDELLIGEAPTSREDKMTWIGQWRDVVAKNLGVEIDITPLKVICGHEPEKTNVLLQRTHELVMMKQDNGTKPNFQAALAAMTEYAENWMNSEDFQKAGEIKIDENSQELDLEKSPSEIIGDDLDNIDGSETKNLLARYGNISDSSSTNSSPDLKRDGSHSPSRDSKEKGSKERELPGISSQNASPNLGYRENDEGSDERRASKDSKGSSPDKKKKDKSSNIHHDPKKLIKLKTQAVLEQDERYTKTENLFADIDRELQIGQEQDRPESRSVRTRNTNNTNTRNFHGNHGGVSHGGSSHGSGNHGGGNRDFADGFAGDEAQDDFGNNGHDDDGPGLGRLDEYMTGTRRGSGDIRGGANHGFGGGGLNNTNLNNNSNSFDGMMNLGMKGEFGNDLDEPFLNRDEERTLGLQPYGDDIKSPESRTSSVKSNGKNMDIVFPMAKSATTNRPRLTASGSSRGELADAAKSRGLIQHGVGAQQILDEDSDSDFKEDFEIKMDGGQPGSKTNSKDLYPRASVTHATRMVASTPFEDPNEEEDTLLMAESNWLENGNAELQTIPEKNKGSESGNEEEDIKSVTSFTKAESKEIPADPNSKQFRLLATISETIPKWVPYLSNSLPSTLGKKYGETIVLDIFRFVLTRSITRSHFDMVNSEGRLLEDGDNAVDPATECFSIPEGTLENLLSNDAVKESLITALETAVDNGSMEGDVSPMSHDQFMNYLHELLTTPDYDTDAFEEIIYLFQSVLTVIPEEQVYERNIFRKYPDQDGNVDRNKGNEIIEQTNQGTGSQPVSSYGQSNNRNEIGASNNTTETGSKYLERYTKTQQRLGAQAANLLGYR